MPDNYSDSKDLAFEIAELALQKKANDIKVLDVHELLQECNGDLGIFLDQ